MNKSILTGRLTKNPDVRSSQGNKPTTVARFALAVERKFKSTGDNQNVDFINCVAFGKLAEFVEKYFKQGMKMNLVGRIQTGSYINNEGSKVYTFAVVAEEIEFGEKKNANSTDNNFDNLEQEFIKIPDDEDLPFN